MGAAPLCLSLLSKLPMERVVASEAPAPLQRAARRAAPAGGRRGVLWLAVLADALMRFKPSEPFLVPYLADATRLGNDAVAARILVVYSYAAFAAAVALPALAALLPALRYKHLLVLCGAARLGTRALLLERHALLRRVHRHLELDLLPDQIVRQPRPLGEAGEAGGRRPPGTREGGGSS